MFHLHSGRAGNVLRKSTAADDAGGVVIEVLPMRRRHLKGVIAIERRIFPSPWSLGLYLSEISQPTTRAY